MNMNRNSQIFPEQEKLTKLCSNAGFSKNIEKGQFFITLDDDTLDKLMGSCREYTLPRSDESSQVKGWIRGNTKTGPVLEVTVCYRQGRYGVEIKIEPLFRDRTCSWDRIVIGNRNVRRDSCGKSWREEYRATCCEGWTTTDTDLDVVFSVYSVLVSESG